jgi:hypothetical protein
VLETVGGLKPLDSGAAPPTLIVVPVGGSSRLKYVDPPGGIAGEKWTTPELVSELTFENQLVGPSYPFCVKPVPETPGST